MIYKLAIILTSVFSISVAQVQTPTQVPDPSKSAGQNQPQPSQKVDDVLDGSGLVINKNTFSYDGNEGRDPFKVYREYIQPATDGAGTTGQNGPQGIEKDIRSVVVPDEVVVQGILFKKNDPVALVVIKGKKGLHKLKVNSLIGRNEGKVIEIRQDKIVVEQVKEFDGQKFTEKIVLEVRAKKN